MQEAAALHVSRRETEIADERRMDVQLLQENRLSLASGAVSSSVAHAQEAEDLVYKQVVAMLKSRRVELSRTGQLEADGKGPSGSRR